MSRVYKCLPQQEFTIGKYKLTPIRDQDKYAIMGWRNDQISILRQKKPLTKADQEYYFSTTIDRLFDQDQPAQLLFSFLYNDVLIGYGGLVHIDWYSRNAEVSFITDTKRNDEAKQFIDDWKVYLQILKLMNEYCLGFNKIYTYAYDLRPTLYTALLESGFIEEARLKNHINVEARLHDVLIHSYFFNDLIFRRANLDDSDLYFRWVNDSQVRENSFHSSEITEQVHSAWFQKRVASENSLLLVALIGVLPVGQLRFDEITNGVFEIDFSIDAKYRGTGLGSKILLQGIDALRFSKPNTLKVIGKVKNQNYSSAKSFIRAGFGGGKENDNFLLFEKIFV